MTDNRVLELYSYACSSGEQNAAVSYIIVHLTYIRGLIHGIGRGDPNERAALRWTASTSLMFFCVYGSQTEVWA